MTTASSAFAPTTARSEPPGTAARGRIVWLDVARGLTIILVVIGHVERGLVTSGIARGPVWAWLDYTLYTFHMPTFFLLSGITASMSLRRRSAGGFLANKLWTIAYPYFLWSAIQGSVMVWVSGLTDSKMSLHGLVTICWQPIGQFWFLYALMICQILGSILFRHRIVLLLLGICLYIPANFLPPRDVYQTTAHFVVFYAIGFFDLSGAIRLLRQRRNELLLPLLACFIFATWWSGIADLTNPYSILSLPSTLSGIGLIIACSQVGEARLIAFLAALGGASMTIYVLHVLFAAGTRILLHRAFSGLDPWTYMAACSAVGLLASYLVHRMLLRFRLLAPLGLASWQRAAA